MSRGNRGFYRVRPGYWFAPKAFGWGAVPVTWQGWLATAIYVALAVAVARIAQHRSSSWLIIFVPLTLGFALLAWAKTDGAWAFRWGPRDR
ncbi:hypothetical protein [Sphingomonas sp.]|jgi:hypothetical protein|uniref:hypothetical protein n=1 Tax=Sphingomonas sp. TaxID=28214 RepID=UPI002ED82955